MFPLVRRYSYFSGPTGIATKKTDTCGRTYQPSIGRGRGHTIDGNRQLRACGVRTLELLYDALRAPPLSPAVEAACLLVWPTVCL